MLEILQYEFMQRALIGGFLLGLICSLIGVFLVLNRLSLLGDSLAHSSFGGVAIGMLFGINPILTALAFVVFVSLVLEKLMDRIKLYGESAIALILAFGMSFALILVGIGNNFGASLFSYLFGSILTLSYFDLVLMGIVLISILIFYKLFYKDLVYLAFNKDVASVRLKRAKLVNTVFIILTALTIVVSIRAVGILLISALVVIPALIGLRVGKSFKKSIFYSMVFGVLGIYVGIFSSYLFNLPAGGTIVMSLILLFVLSLFFKK